MKKLGIKMVEHNGKDGSLMLYIVVQKVDQLVAVVIHGWLSFKATPCNLIQQLVIFRGNQLKS